MLNLLLDNLLNPALLFFLMGILAVSFKSDLSIPDSSSKFISLYLLFSIGFNGGRELNHSEFTPDMIYTIIFSVLLSLIIPIYVFFFVKKRLGVHNAGAIAASYGSVSAVTFVTAVSFLQMYSLSFDGYMVASLAFMEAPAIIMGVMLTRYFGKMKKEGDNIGKIIKHSMLNGSVVLILGSLLIGLLSNETQAMDIQPFTTDIFKGFLAVFLLDMGLQAGRKLKSFFKNGWFTILSAIGFSLINGIIVGILSGFFMDDIGNRFLITILGASASYIAVPAAMRISMPKADAGIYLPMALAVSFPFNITIGFPIYYWIVNFF